MTSANIPDQFADKQVRSRSWINYAVAIGLIAVIAFALLYHLDHFPAPWYDEGSHLHVAKNFGVNGIYSDYSSEGLRPFGPAIGVGPTVMVPIAYVFRIFGVNMSLARGIIAVYGFLALAVFWKLTSLFLPLRTRLLAFLLLFLSPSIDFIYSSRTVLGEVPGLFFLVTGLWIWLRPGTRSIPALVAVGVFMGLTCITKNQFAVAVLPALLLSWFADLLWYRRRGWMYFVIPGVVAGIMFFVWLYIVIIRLGNEGGSFADNLNTLRTASTGAFLVLSRNSLERAGRFLVDNAVFGAFFIPSFIYGLINSLRRDENGQKHGIVMLFVAVGTAVFIASLGWPRYAFIPLALLTIYAAGLIDELFSNIHWNRDTFRDMMKGKVSDISVLISLVVVSWIMIAVILPIYSQLHRVISDGNTTAYMVAEWLDENVPKDALIETWEQELGVISDHNFHFPPQIVLADSVAAKWENGSPAVDFYDFRDYVKPDYIIIGTFDKYTDVYPEDRRTDFELVTTIGDYDIYQRKASP